MVSFPSRILLAVIASAISFNALPAALELAEPGVSERVFPLVASGAAASIVLSADAPEVVRIAAADLARDIETITGTKPEITSDAAADANLPRIEVGTAPDLEGRWEAFRLSANEEVLTVAGADARALAYGLYELSRRIGVSPWAWWADVPVPRRPELFLTLGEGSVEAPAVRYRGIFLNDEGWGLRPWAATTFEPEVGNIGPRTYAKIFELLLRLRANTIWPAMHPGTTPFHLVPGNAETADAYAIVVGSSHAEPMLRNNVGEWVGDHDHYNYLTHREEVLDYWGSRVRERVSGESIFTIGMRGIHDSAIVGPRNQEERIATLEQIFADQRHLLAQQLGGGDPAQVPQMFCPYKEVLDDYNAGLQVPDDVTLVWPDDNFGYVRRYGTEEERGRSGGTGVYYHLSYLGSPMSWLWLDSHAHALVWSEMTRAYEQGAETLWIANVGDLKGTERSTEFFLDLAWHADRSSPDEPRRFLRRMAARDFGEARAGAVADIWARHQQLAFARKPEHLQWNLPLTPYEPTELTAREITERVGAYAALVEAVDEVAAGLEAEQQDAFFQLVEYPVAAAAAANERYFLAELSRIQRARGEGSANATFARTDESELRIQELTMRYNNLADGKWRYVMTTNGISPRVWRRYQPESAILPLNSHAQNAVRAPDPEPEPAPATVPADARAGDFVETGGVVSIHAGHFASRQDLPDGAGWRVVDGLGHTGSAVTVLPSTTEIDADSAPVLSYRFFVSNEGETAVHFHLLPTFPIDPGNGLRLAFAIDGGAPHSAVVSEGFEPGSEAWKERVLSNRIETAVTLPEPLASGWHTLDLIAVDPGVVVDKIVIDLGGLRPSYNGPDETRVLDSRTR